MSRKEAAARAVELLGEMGITEPSRRFDQYPHNLSGGMRQRVTIARALSCSPKLLIADEPTTALDVTIQRQILNLLQRLQQEHGMSMIVITHDLGVAATRTDEIIVMYAGQIVERAPTAVLFSQMRHPYTRALVDSVPKITDPSQKRPRAISGRPPVVIEPGVGCRFAPRCPNVQPRCTEETPPLIQQPGVAEHVYACFFPVGTPPDGEPTTIDVPTEG
jgi:peptide/nickel transport system ATP-binding protein